MALDFSIVVNVRHQFGDKDEDIGVFAGREKSWTFNCPSVSSGQALLLFQGSGVLQEQVLEINRRPIPGGIPTTAASTASIGTSFDPPRHTHPLTGAQIGWAGNVLFIDSGVLRDTGNVLRVASNGETFLIDNVVVVYKTRR